MGGVLHAHNAPPNAQSAKAIVAKTAPSQPAGAQAGN